MMIDNIALNAALPVNTCLADQAIRLSAISAVFRYFEGPEVLSLHLLGLPEGST